ncbi:hypothetical protein BC831DRAFT_531465, partial [Entophlyctis helioformis]
MDGGSLLTGEYEYKTPLGEGSIDCGRQEASVAVRDDRRQQAVASEHPSVEEQRGKILGSRIASCWHALDKLCQAIHNHRHSVVALVRHGHECNVARHRLEVVGRDGQRVQQTGRSLRRRVEPLTGVARAHKAADRRSHVWPEVVRTQTASSAILVALANAALAAFMAAHVGEIGKEHAEQLRNLAAGRKVKAHAHVDATRPDQRVVQLLDLVRGHDQYAAHTRRQTVERIQQSRQRDSVGSSLVVLVVVAVAVAVLVAARVTASRVAVIAQPPWPFPSPLLCASLRLANSASTSSMSTMRRLGMPAKMSTSALPLMPKPVRLSTYTSSSSAPASAV